MKVYDIIADKYYPVDRSDLDEGIKKKIIQKILPSKKPKGLAPSSKRAKEYKDMLKQNKADAAATKAARDAAARKYAERRISSLTPSANALVTAGGISYYVYDYFQAIAPLETEWLEYKNNGYKADPPNRFAGMPYEEAIIRAENDRQALLGKATVGIITSSGFIGKFIGWMGKGVQFTGLGVAAVGAPMKGAAVGAAGKILTGISNLITNTAMKHPKWTAAGRVALIAFMESPIMKPIVESAIAYSIFGSIGYFTSKVLEGLNMAYKAFQKFMKDTFNINIPDIAPSITDTPIKRDPEKEKEIADRNEKSKAAMINGVDVLDPDGYLTTNPRILGSVPVQQELDVAHLERKPNPLDDLKKYPRRPGAVYPEKLMKSTKSGPGYTGS